MRSFPKGVEEQRTFFLEIGNAMNEVEVACARVDEHEESKLTDWSALAEIQSQKIHDLIVRLNLDSGPSGSVDSGFHALSKSLKGYRLVIGKRLRHQRKAMLDF